MNRNCLAFIHLVVLVLAACNAPEKIAIISDRAMPEASPIRFEGMGHHMRAITTDSAECQAFFNQGLTWAYAFNHDEAIRSFKEAARHDPQCAMAWWGIALCNGPHINNPIMPPERSQAAWDTVQMAMSLRENASYPEGRLIEALAKRYAATPPADRRPLDEAYAAAMQEVYELDVNDSDMATLYAESLMDLQPWDLWDKNGNAKGRTNEILAILEHALKINPNNPGANHLYIHAVEASSQPQRAVVSADRLRTLVPGSGHLVHMPSHIDVRVGNWALAADQNVAAIKADSDYRKLSPRQGFYNLYMIHNHHMLAFASMMEGRSATAIQAGREVVEMLPQEYLRSQAALADPFMGAKYDALKRFGKWDELLREPAPHSFLPITTAMWRFSRGLAYAAKGEIRRATREQGAFRAAVKNVPADALMAINSAHTVLSIADHMLAGEIAYRKGDFDEAVRELREGVRIEDGLLYMEPPEWIQPVRHTLGAILVDAKRFAEAEQVYRDDLAQWPGNAWSLFGLAQSLRGQGKTMEADQAEQRFKQAWARADVKIGASCLCVSGT